MSHAPSSEDITALLANLEAGGSEAAEPLWRAIYPDLRRIAHHALRRRHGHSLETTALVNEAYLKLVNHQQEDWTGRLHFLSVAAKAMRHILIDHARQRGRQKRGGGDGAVSLDEAVLVMAEERGNTLLALDEALTRLASRDERLAQVVEYRFFGGLTEEEIGKLLHVTERTVRRDWRKAKAWLALALSDSPDSPPSA